MGKRRPSLFGASEGEAAKEAGGSARPKKKARLQRGNSDQGLLQRQRRGDGALVRKSATFEGLGCLAAPIVCALQKLGFSHCTPVQEATLPLLLPPLRAAATATAAGNGEKDEASARDVAVEAPTGSGKTLAFLLPVVSRLALRLLAEATEDARREWRRSSLQGGGKESSATSEALAEALLGEKAQTESEGEGGCAVAAVVLSPTRELCFQICSVLEGLLKSLEEALLASSASKKKLRIRSLRLTGGAQREVGSSLEALSRRGDVGSLHVLCATPGRLLGVLEAALASKTPHSTLRWEELQFFVVDEADRLLDEQHAEQLVEIHEALTRLRSESLLPKERRLQARLKVALFSATLSQAMEQRLLRKILKEPYCVRVAAADSLNAEAAPQEREQQGPQGPQGSQGSQGPASHAPVQHSVPQTLTNAVLSLDYDEKIPFLYSFIKDVVLPRKQRCIVFCLTCQYVEYLFSLLGELFERGESGTPKEGNHRQAGSLSRGGGGCLEKLHGKMKQRARWAALSRFSPSLREGKASAPPSEGRVLLATDVAARGLDFPEVEHIVQLDPPQNPEVFVHRVGRTARAGRGGSALLILLPHEDAYEAFLNNRGVPLVPFKETPEAALVDSPRVGKTSSSVGDSQAEPLRCLYRREEVNAFLMKAVEQDQALILKGSRAFVSYVRAYKEHKLSFLLPFSRLDLGKLATALRLLRMPRVREVKGRNFSNFVQSSVDPAKVPFKHDPQREEERLQNLEGLLAKREEQRREREKRQKQETKLKEKRSLKKQKRTRSEKRQAKKRSTLDEWQELAFEERLARKLRRGRISEAQYEAELEKGPLPQQSEAMSGPESDESECADSGDDEAGEQKFCEGSVTVSANKRGRRRPSWAARRKGTKKKRR